VSVELTAKSRVRLRPDVACREVDGEFYLLTADSVFHSVTDPVGAFVLGLLDSAEGRSRDEIVDRVREAFEGTGEGMPAEIAAFLADLIDRGIAVAT
jgi:hypothetical protein